MHSLYHALLAQHSRQVTPVRCARQTIAQLHTYFEDVVLENNLSALVVESLPAMSERPLREIARVREVGRAALHSFFFVAPDDQLSRIRRAQVRAESDLAPTHRLRDDEARAIATRASRSRSRRRTHRHRDPQHA